jgi:hypothetical protein
MKQLIISLLLACSLSAQVPYGTWFGEHCFDEVNRGVALRFFRADDQLDVTIDLTGWWSQYPCGFWFDTQELPFPIQMDFCMLYVAPKVFIPLPNARATFRPRFPSGMSIYAQGATLTPTRLILSQGVRLP